jgi:hypothetical protein
MPTDQHQLAPPIRAADPRPVQFLEDARERIVGLALSCADCVLAPLLLLIIGGEGGKKSTFMQLARGQPVRAHRSVGNLGHCSGR